MRDALTHRSGSNPSLLTRDDIATVTSVYKRETVKFNRWASAGLVGGLLTGAAAMGVADMLAWAQSWDPIFLLGGWVLGIGGMALARRQRRRNLADINLHCETCSTPLIEDVSGFFRPNSDKQAIARAEMIVATGGCPTCGADFLADESSQRRLR